MELDAATLWEITARTLAVCGAALVASLLLGLPVGIALGRRRFPARVALVSVINSGMGAPPVVVGLVVALLFWRRGSLGFLGLMYTPEGMVTVRVAEIDNDFQIEVIDTGIGIPPEDLTRVFDDFFRASNVEVRGTGLGLSITRRIVEAHGGRIWAESPCPETNKGSKFTLTLHKRSKAEKR